MIRFIIAILLLSFSCRQRKRSDSEVKSAHLDEAEIHIFCHADLKSEKLQNVLIENIFYAHTPGDVKTLVQRPGALTPQMLEATSKDEHSFSFKPNSADLFQVTIQGEPYISDAQDPESRRPCVKIVQSRQNRQPNLVKPVQCNAQGTPAQGWYQSGRVLKHSQTCHMETLSCGVHPEEGWYLQQKHSYILAKTEQCSWIKELPECKSNTVKGWYLSDKLITRDDECSHKFIECSHQGSGQEGWYVYELSKPTLYLTQLCLTKASREISYLRP